MNEDDYDFDTTENSRLSYLFGRDHEATNSSLIYKSPKEPGNISDNSRSTSSKTFHKFIKLYNNNNGTLYGKYVIAIISSEVNYSEVLIYQTKKNIFIRFPAHGKSLYVSTKNNTLILNENDQQYKLEYENSNELLDFTREYTKNKGCIIEMSEHQKFPNTEIPHKKSEIDFEGQPEELVEEREIVRSNKNDKNYILTRLEKLGLPQLLPIQKGREDTGIYDIADTNISSNVNFISTGKHITKSDVREDDESMDGYPIISDRPNQPVEKIPVCPKFFITQEQTNLLTSLLEDNQKNNSELREAISLLTSKLKEIIPTTELEDRNKVKILESRIKTLELKCENLQSELRKCNENYSERSILKRIPEQNKKKQCENSCQTNDLECNREDIKQIESILIQMIEIVNSLPLTSVEITKLNNVKQSIENVTSISGLLLHFKSIVEKDILTSKPDILASRKFVGELKKTMNEMYQNICSTDGSIDARDLLAKQIKLATIEILRNYDISLEHTKM